MLSRWILQAVLLGLPAGALAFQVPLFWDRNPEADLAGYVLYNGTQSGQYDHSFWIDKEACTGDVCQVTLELSEGHWYASVTAVNDAGLESEPSEEIHIILGQDQPVVLYPNGSIRWIRGCPYEILWENFDAGNVSLRLMKDGRLHRKIAKKTANDGQFVWNVHKAQAPGDGFRVQVSAGGQSDLSDEALEVVAPTVLAPADGASLARGAVHTIQWDNETFCGSDVHVYLYRKKRAFRDIALSAPNTGTLQWLVPGDLPPAGTYRLRIQSAAHGTCAAYSDGLFVVN
jgi:hypothetical protein